MPYSGACKILRELTYLVVPSDMLHCLWKVGREIYKIAELYAAANERKLVAAMEARGEDVDKRKKKRPEGIGADDFVPIFLWVTIHALLPTPFQICTCIKRCVICVKTDGFCTKDERFFALNELFINGFCIQMMNLVGSRLTPSGTQRRATI